MSYRGGYRNGDWLVIDDESGQTKYASHTTQDYYGRRIDKNYADWAHPQDFIRALDDPIPLPFLRTRAVSAACVFASRTVGVTDVRADTRSSPGFHLYDPGISDMQIGCSFVVR